MNKCIFLFALVLCITSESMIYLSRDTRLKRLQGREGREKTGRMKEKRGRKEIRSDIIYRR